MLLPPEPVAVNETVKLPGVRYSCAGFCNEDESPSPKSQSHALILPVDKSVKLTINGASPNVGVPENSAIGASSEIVI